MQTNWNPTERQSCEQEQVFGLVGRATAEFLACSVNVESSTYKKADPTI